MARERRFAVEKNGDKRLLVRWRGIWKNVEVLWDGQPLGEPIASFRDLKAGKSYPLPDGRSVYVYFDQKYGGGGLSVTVDGRPVAGAANDPRTAIKHAAVLLWIIAGLNIVIGAIALGVAGLQAMGVGWPTLAFGAVLAVLAFCVQRYRSQVAIVIAIIIEIVDGLVLAVTLFSAGGRMQPFPIFIRVFIVMALFRAFKAVKEAQKVEADEIVDTFR